MNINNLSPDVALLFSSQLRLNASATEDVTFTLSKTETNIDGYLRQLQWYHNMAEPGFGVPLKDDNKWYTLSPDKLSLTLTNIRPEDAGIYTARYDGLVLYPHNKSCEQQLLQTLRHYPVFEPVTFTLSVDGRGGHIKKQSLQFTQVLLYCQVQTILEKLSRISPKIHIQPHLVMVNLLH